MKRTVALLQTITLRAVPLILIALILAASARAQNETVIPRNSKVYIVPMDGFETYIAAAFDKKKVPLIVVNTRELADFEISGTSEMTKAGWAKTIFGGGRPQVDANCKVVNIKTGVVAYAVASHKANANSGHKSAAEHIAKNIGKKMRNDVKKQ